MAKQSGLGDNFYFRTRNLSGDIGSISISSPNTPLEVTAIDKSAMERLGGLRSGTMEWTAFFNDATGQEHTAFSTLLTSNQGCMYTRGTSIGSAAACMLAKQVNYDPTRGADGSLTISVQALSDSYGLQWGELLTAGMRTDTGATNGASLDTAQSLSFGAQAFLHVPAFSGTDVTVKIQDSADDSSWADVASLAFTQITGTTSERIAIGNTATVRRYVRAVTVTTGGFTSVTFAVAIVKNQIAGMVF